MEIIAKASKDKSYKTLEEHTDDLLKNLELLKSIYPDVLDDKTYLALKIACIFHDLGKVSYQFQKKIYRLLDKNIVKDKDGEKLKREVPHNFLSGAFLISKDVREKIKSDLGDELFDAILFAVLFHHDRSIDFSEEDYKKTLEHISNNIHLLSWLKKYGFNLQTDIQKHFGFYNKIKILANEKKKLDKYRIVIKGLLHRIDHSASASIEIERKPIDNYTQKFNTYLTSKKINLMDFQKKARELTDKDVLLVASTGLGKTEFAMNWIDGKKAFYTLPVRVSVNAMYERFKSVFGESDIGLLHSFAKFYEVEKNEDIETGLNKINLSRLLSMPITITTADQLFTSVFKYNGFEKIYATLSYSKVVIDEPQGYSPKTLAYIIKAIKELKELGSKFLVMTATLHPFLKEELTDFEFLKQLSHIKKHKIKLEDKNLDDLRDEIIKAYEKGKKVLVITNTVKKSQQLYQILKSGNINVKLLHSLFIQREKSKREKEIQEENNPVVWITTQIVEASLDIDYDMLFTELSPIDSLIQRMGRVYRNNQRYIDDNQEPNIVIATENPSGQGTVYYKEIIERTLNHLENYDCKILTEEIKREIMEKVYKKDEITEFYEEFKNNLELLDLGFQADNKQEAEKLFREIYNYTVIPEKIYKENFGEIESLINTVFKPENSTAKLTALKKLYDYTLQLPFYRVKSVAKTDMNGVYTVNIEYDEEIGVNLLVEDNREVGEFI
ncbi:MAG: CRISPR-associated helicase Cas3' [Hydrogenothermaceae bacterium]